MTRLLFWASVSLCAIAQGAIIFSALRSPGDHQSTDAESIPSPSRTIEIIWTVIPAVALAVLLWATWKLIITPPAAVMQQVIL